MENEVQNSNISDNNNITDLSEKALAYDYYDYREVIEKQNAIIENQNNTYNLLNYGFTFISFILIVFFIYSYFKNMIRK